MAPPNAETEIRVASEAAETFASHYYQALNGRTSLDAFYVNSSTRYATQADISINGRVLASPADYATLLDAQGKGVRYDVESLDAHVVNPTSALAAPDRARDDERAERNGSRMTIAVTTMGRVQFGSARDAPQRMFNETFVLVPNWDALVKNPPRGIKRWLIMSQNFRAL